MGVKGVSDAASSRREGLKVTLEPIPGITPKGLLGRNGFFFQVPPLDEFSHAYSYAHTDYTTLRNGVFSRKGGVELRSTQFDTLAVDYASWAFYNATDIELVTSTLIEICESGEAVLLTAAHDFPARGYANWDRTMAGPELQWAATLRQMTVAEKAGEGDARYLNLSFTEFRNAQVDARGLGKRQGSDTFQLPTTVTLHSDGTAVVDANGLQIGEPPVEPVTFHSLAEGFYSDASKWRVIAKANNISNWRADDALVLYPRFQSILLPGGKRKDLKDGDSRYTDARVAKLKIPKVGAGSKVSDGNYGAAGGRIVGAQI